MKERPILFSGPMVRAILAGTKTQTRRLMYVETKNVNSATFDRRYPPDYGNDEWPNLPPGRAWTLSDWRKTRPGDKLWAREAWRTDDSGDDGRAPRDLSPQYTRLVYVATDDRVSPLMGKLRPSMFMPRWASRITLEVTGMRVERLQDISEQDAIAEGVERLQGIGKGSTRWRHYGTKALHDEGYSAAWEFARNSYASLWESINGPWSWDANPWVWVVEFKRSA